jgi:hypothetical protein
MGMVVVVKGGDETVLGLLSCMDIECNKTYFK